jgi:glutamate-1-semialdehyde aminotransferase
VSAIASRIESAQNVIPPEDFVHAVREIADEFGALLIADEILTAALWEEGMDIDGWVETAF